MIPINLSSLATPVLTEAAIRFFTPARAALMFKAALESLDVVAAKIGDRPAEEQAKEFGEALSANLDVAFSIVPGCEEEKAEVKARLVPWLTDLIYGNPEATDKAITDAQEDSHG